MKNTDFLKQTEIEKILCGLEEKIVIKGIWEYNNLIDDLNRLCASYIYQYIRTSGISCEKSRKYDAFEIKGKLRIIPTFDKFFNFFLLVLEEDGIIVKTGSEIQFIKSPEEIEDCDGLENELRIKHKEFKGLFDLLHHCYMNYPKALSGDMPSILVLFPYGKQDFMTECINNTVEYGKERVLCKLLGAIIKMIVDSRGSQSIRIIEVGGGSARLTKEVAEALEGAETVEYYFTDISPVLFRKFEEQHLIKNVICKTFDITKEPCGQGFESESFDLVIGLNVVHATRNIRESIQNLTKLLVPGGHLMLIEDIKRQRWVDMVWGLADGWWSFEDYDLRTDSPLISLEQWKGVLAESEFGNIMTVPQVNVADGKYDCGLISGKKYNYNDEGN